MEIIIDRVGLWKAKAVDALTVRTVPAGVEYKESEGGELMSSAKPMLRYAKNFELEGQKFCLFVRTFRKDKAGVVEELNEISKKVTKTDLETLADLIRINGFMSFKYMKYKIGEDK